MRGMTTLEQVELVEAWAWLEVGGGLPLWDDRVGARGKMEYEFFRYMRYKYTHVKPRLYKQALWSAMVFLGEPRTPYLVERAKNKVDKKWTRKMAPKNPLEPWNVDEAVKNLPPFEPPFDDARRLTKAFLGIAEDDWSIAAWFADGGMPLYVPDIMDFRPDMTPYKIRRRIELANREDAAHD